MNGLSNLYIPVCGLLIAILCSICFFSKERVKNKETSIFARILIYSLVDSVMMVVIFLLAIYRSDLKVLLEFLNKVDYAMYLLWSSNFFLYVYYITSKDQTTGVAKFYNWFFYFTTIIDVSIMLILLFLPVNVHINGNVMYSDGAALTCALIGCAIYFVSIIICLILNVKKIKPDFLIIIDALATSSIDRLNKTIQITNSGIVPGSGVNNSRISISKETLGIPVIVIGIPTIIDSSVIIEVEKRICYKFDTADAFVLI